MEKQQGGWKGVILFILAVAMAYLASLH